AGLLVRLARIVVRIDLPETAGLGDPVGIEPMTRGPPFGREEMKLKPVDEKTVAIIGAGPAGLTAAYLLSKEGIPTTVLEADPHLVGGIARTASYHGVHFDIGGHRFFSKSKEVGTSGRSCCPRTCSSGRACRASTTGGSSSPIRSRPSRRSSSWASSNRSSACSPT